MTSKKHARPEDGEQAPEEAANAPGGPEAAPEPPAAGPEGADTGGAEALAAAEERYVRLYAEFENYKKRTGRENEDFRRYANEAVLKELLPVLDNLERAVAHTREAEQGIEKLLEGVELIVKQFGEVLAKFGVSPIPALGKPFDPAVHQAVSQQETADAPEGSVLSELQRGYFYRERVLRPAMVVVAKGATGKQA
jgi:molecular chaperone GrpE